jgi:uncharacterized membrane protein (DUF106 family)
MLHRQRSANNTGCYEIRLTGFNLYCFLFSFPAIGNTVVTLANFLSADMSLLMYPVCALTVSNVLFFRKICVISIKRLLGHPVYTAFCK